MLLRLLTRIRELFVAFIGVTPSQALAFVISGSTTLYAVLHSVQVSHLSLPHFADAAICWTLSACRSVQLINSGIVPVATPGTSCTTAPPTSQDNPL